MSFVDSQKKVGEGAEAHAPADRARISPVILRAKERLESLLGPSGVRFNGAQPWDIQVHDQRFYPRVLANPAMALGEAYMDGWWSCERIDELAYRILRHVENGGRISWRDWWEAAQAWFFNRQSRERSRQVGEQHYDLGNDLFRAMLDPRMVYSGAYWKDCETLDAAQESKLDLLCRKLKLNPGQKLLDIGCGWGSLLRYAAENYGAAGTGLTVSREQVVEANEAIPQGLPVRVCLEDYREHQRRYDRACSVGMFEHVGPKNHRNFFEVCRKLLKEDDGLLVVQTIGSNRTRSSGNSWHAKYIFPNGDLPSAKQVAAASEGQLIIEDWQNLGPDYDRTLMAWYRRFRDAWPQLKEHYSERFRRMWDYYLLSCAGSFRAREIQLWQIVLSPRGQAAKRYDAPR